LFALMPLGRMDLWMWEKKLTPLNNFIYFCVYDIDRREQYRMPEYCGNL